MIPDYHFENSDIVGLYGAVSKDLDLLLCGEVKDEIGNMPTYTILVRSGEAPDFPIYSLKYHSKNAQNTASAARSFVCGSIPLADFKNSTYLMLGFQTSTPGLGIIDHIGWLVINLPKDVKNQ